MLDRKKLQITSEPRMEFEGHETTIVTVSRGGQLLTRARYYYGSGEITVLESPFHRLSHWAKTQIVEILNDFCEDLEIGLA